MTKTYTCKCGHVVHWSEPIKVIHEPDGGHRYVVIAKIGSNWGGKRANG